MSMFKQEQSILYSNISYVNLYFIRNKVKSRHFQGPPLKRVSRHRALWNNEDGDQDEKENQNDQDDHQGG